jgi:hypothetical protein
MGLGHLNFLKNYWARKAEIYMKVF